MSEAPAPASSQAVEKHDAGARAGRGILLIAAGIFFLYQNYGQASDYAIPRKWWTLLIWIPALGSFFRAWQLYRKERRLSRDAGRLILGGVSIGLVACILMLDLDFGKIWPVFLVLGGVSTVFFQKK